MPIFLLLYIYCALLEIIALLLADSFPQLVWITKPALMILLAAYAYQEMKPNFRKWDKFLLLALFSSWLGDVFLMASADIFFLLGLGAFLITHIFYILIFKRDFQLTDKVNFSLAFGMLALYGLGLLKNLLPNLPSDMHIPIAIYAFTILTMVITAVGRKGNVSRESHNLVLIGAVSFMISDSLIAMNKFVSEIPNANIWIMLLYMVGQLLIVKGYLAKSSL
jgi:uncharacterized membrane protein YhhN